MDKTDFDVNNYSTEDLLHILGLQNDVPLESADLIDRIKIFKEKFNDNVEYLKFFGDVEERLLKEKDEIRKDNVNYDNNDEDSNVVEEDNEYEYDDDRADSNFIIPPSNRDVLVAKQSIYERGLHNPRKIDTINIPITFNSRNRNKTEINTVTCPDGTIKKGVSKYFEGECDYKATLVEPLTNVIELCVNTIELPMNWWVFSEDYGTNSLNVKRGINTTKYEIDSGNYNSTDLISELNTKLSGSDIEIIYNSNKNKVSIKNTGGDTATVYWYMKSVNLTCGRNGNGQKVDYNLGWLLGFRNTEMEIGSGGVVEAEGLLDVDGPDYLYLYVDDYINNKSTQNVETMGKAESKFKMPKYYNKNTMSDGCEVQVQEQGCVNVKENVDDINNLTSAQKYTINQIHMAMSNASKSESYDVTNYNDILYKISLQNRTMFNKVSIVNRTKDYKRIYLGPVNLQMFRIKLMTDKGLVLNLNNSNWSFTCIATRLNASV